GEAVVEHGELANEAGGGGAAHVVGCGRPGAGAKQRHIKAQAGDLGLVPVGVAGGTARIAVPERHGAAASFEVNSPPAAGAVVNGQARVPGEQFVPERVMALDIANLGQSLPVRRVRVPPETERIKVEVVA